MVKKVLVLLISLISVSIIFGQDTYVKSYSRGKHEGFVEMRDGEIVKGTLKLKGKIKNQSQISMILDEGVEAIYTPDEISSYGFDNVKFMAVHNGEFRQLLVEGCLNIFVYYYMTISAAYTGAAPMIMPHRASRIEKMYRDGGVINVFNGPFKKEWSSMLSDNEEISTKILNKVYKRRDYLRVAELYNESCND